MSNTSRPLPSSIDYSINYADDRTNNSYPPIANGELSARKI